MTTIIPANPPSKGSNHRRATMEKSGMNTKGTNIQVVLRCKGKTSHNTQKSQHSSILEFMESKDTDANANETYTDQNDLSRSTATKPVTDVLLNTNNTIYSFDRVFKPEESQAAVYKDVAEPILNDVLAGFSCTIFAYGQTGTGKTFTMEGDLNEVDGNQSKDAGIIPRTIHDLFQKLPAESHVTVSMLELYNEELRDLLCASDNQKSLNIYEEHGIAKVNCQDYHISSVSNGLDIMKKGIRKRMTAATNCNEHSSRSHCIFTLTVRTSKKTDKGEDVFSIGKLNLVDLAGSENNRNSGSENLRAREAANINRSLLTLGRVVNCLVDKTAHIPYRESKLTRILKDSLGGNTKTCIIATVAPANQIQEEIKSTLEYASHAKGICNQPRSNNVINRERHLDSLVHTIEQLQNELRVNYEKQGVYMSKKTYDQKNEEFLRLKSSMEEIMAQNKTFATLLEGKDKIFEEERRRQKEEIEEERRRRKEDVESQRSEFLDLLVKYKDEQMIATEKQWNRYMKEAKQKTARAVAESANPTTEATPASSTAVPPVLSEHIAAPASSSSMATLTPTAISAQNTTTASNNTLSTARKNTPSKVDAGGPAKAEQPARKSNANKTTTPPTTQRKSNIPKSRTQAQRPIPPPPTKTNNRFMAYTKASSNVPSTPRPLPKNSTFSPVSRTNFIRKRGREDDETAQQRPLKILR